MNLQSLLHEICAAVHMLILLQAKHIQDKDLLQLGNLAFHTVFPDITHQGNFIVSKNFPWSFSVVHVGLLDHLAQNNVW